MKKFILTEEQEAIRKKITDVSKNNIPNTLNAYLSILCMKIDVILKLNEDQHINKHTNNEIKKAIELALLETKDSLKINNINIEKFLEKN